MTDNLYPLTLLRNFDDLICGAMPIGQKKDRIKSEIKYPWNLIVCLKDEMLADFQIHKPEIKGNIHESAVLIHKENIHVGEGAQISACAVLDATNGPIFIGEGTIVHPQALLRGPLYIGKNCRIAGEVVNSIFMDNVNKAHYGFIGHSYICPWVNLGAGTTNSNLKNNYGSVKVFVDGAMVETNQTFVGCFVGDYAKTAIGSMIYTGCVIGAFANLFGQPLYKKYVPSFSWGGGKEVYKLQEAISAAEAMMKRRGKELTVQDKEQIQKVFELTKGERA